MEYKWLLLSGTMRIRCLLICLNEMSVRIFNWTVNDWSDVSTSITNYTWIQQLKSLFHKSRNSMDHTGNRMSTRNVRFWQTMKSRTLTLIFFFHPNQNTMARYMDLQAFILRARVLKLYRQALRISRRAPSHTRGILFEHFSFLN